MTNPGVLLDAVISSVRALSGLVTGHLEGDESRVFAYRDRYSRESNLQKAILNAPKPSILVAYMGMLVPTDSDTMEAYRHRFACYFRAADAAEDHYFGMLQKLVDGLTASGLEWRYSTIHEDCFPPDKIGFKRVVNAPDELDFWEFSFILTENGG